MRRVALVVLGVALGASAVALAPSTSGPSTTAYSCQNPTNGNLGTVSINRIPSCAKGYMLASWSVTVSSPTTTSTTLAPTTTTQLIPPASTTAPTTGRTLTFTPANWPRRYGTCAAPDSPTQLRFNITSACNPAGDGHYRTDWSNIGTFTAGTTTCVSIPVSFPNGTPTIPSSSWWQFAEAKTPTNVNGWADWALYVVNGNTFDFRMGWVTGPSTQGNGSDHPRLWSGGSTAGTNTFQVCSNYSTTTNGFLDLSLNGTRVLHVAGVFILKGQTSTDLDMNDYTGGGPSNVEIHGAPTVTP